MEELPRDIELMTHVLHFDWLATTEIPHVDAEEDLLRRRNLAEFRDVLFESREILAVPRPEKNRVDALKRMADRRLDLPRIENKPRLGTRRTTERGKLGPVALHLFQREAGRLGRDTSGRTLLKDIRAALEEVVVVHPRHVRERLHRVKAALRKLVFRRPAVVAAGDPRETLGLPEVLKVRTVLRRREPAHGADVRNAHVADRVAHRDWRAHGDVVDVVRAVVDARIVAPHPTAIPKLGVVRHEVWEADGDARLRRAPSRIVVEVRNLRDALPDPELLANDAVRHVRTASPRHKLGDKRPADDQLLARLHHAVIGDLPRADADARILQHRIAGAQAFERDLGHALRPGEPPVDVDEAVARALRVERRMRNRIGHRLFGADRDGPDTIRGDRERDGQLLPHLPRAFATHPPHHGLRLAGLEDRNRHGRTGRDARGNREAGRNAQRGRHVAERRFLRCRKPLGRAAVDDRRRRQLEVVGERLAEIVGKHDLRHEMAAHDVHAHVLAGEHDAHAVVHRGEVGHVLRRHGRIVVPVTVREVRRIEEVAKVLGEVCLGDCEALLPRADAHTAGMRELAEVRPVVVRRELLAALRPEGVVRISEETVRQLAGPDEVSPVAGNHLRRMHVLPRLEPVEEPVVRHEPHEKPHVRRILLDAAVDVRQRLGVLAAPPDAHVAIPLRHLPARLSLVEIPKLREVFVDRRARRNLLENRDVAAELVRHLLEQRRAVDVLGLCHIVEHEMQVAERLVEERLLRLGVVEVVEESDVAALRLRRVRRAQVTWLGPEADDNLHLRVDLQLGVEPVGRAPVDGLVGERHHRPVVPRHVERRAIAPCIARPVAADAQVEMSVGERLARLGGSCEERADRADQQTRSLLFRHFRAPFF